MAMAWPMPWLLPVTSAILPESFMKDLSLEVTTFPYARFANLQGKVFSPQAGLAAITAEIARFRGPAGAEPSPPRERYCVERGEGSHWLPHAPARFRHVEPRSRPRRNSRHRLDDPRHPV